MSSIGRYAQLQMEFSAAVRTSAEQKELILKLEQDLSTIQAMSSLPRPDADGSEVGNMGNIPEPIKEATAMFAGMHLHLKSCLFKMLEGWLKSSRWHHLSWKKDDVIWRSYSFLEREQVRQYLV